MSRDTVAPDERDGFWVWLQRRLRKPKASAAKVIAGGHPVFSAAAVEAELARLRDAGKIACTNGKWWVR